MAALPKKKISRTRGRTRRGHIKVTLPTLAKCPNCGSPKLPHAICPECGWYKGRKVITTKLDDRIAAKLRATQKAEKLKAAQAKKAAAKAEKDAKLAEKKAAKKETTKKSGDKK